MGRRARDGTGGGGLGLRCGRATLACRAGGRAPGLLGGRAAWACASINMHLKSKICRKKQEICRKYAEKYRKYAENTENMQKYANKYAKKYRNMDSLSKNIENMEKLEICTYMHKYAAQICKNMLKKYA